VVDGNLVRRLPAAFELAADALAAPSLPRHVVVLDFRGLSMTDVWAVALKGGVKVKVGRLPDDFPVVLGHEPPTEGRVVQQSLVPGTEVHRGAEVELFVQFPPVGV
jgi:hypothetical protein